MSGTCARCGGTANEFITLQSQYKSTQIDLCRACFQAARDLWEKFIGFVPNPDNQQQTPTGGENPQLAAGPQVISRG
jgi:hypothetical protein